MESLQIRPDVLLRLFTYLTQVKRKVALHFVVSSLEVFMSSQKHVV